ncbi:MAG: radical SAM protein, partial [Candidatus Hodarchaeota archaeon]
LYGLGFGSSFPELTVRMYKNAYENIVKGIKILQKHNIPFGVISVINKNNYKKAKEMVNHFYSLGFENGKFNPVIKQGKANTNWNEISITPLQYYEFMKDLLSHIVKKDINFKESNLMYMIHNLIKRTRNYRCMRSLCGAGEDYIVIDPKGNLYPCARYTSDNNLCLGNILNVNNNLSASYLNNKIILNLKKRIVEKINTCKHCTYKHFCEGGCSLSAYEKNGMIYEPDPMCDFYKNMYPHLLNYLLENPTAALKFVPEAEYIHTLNFGD